VSDSTLVVAARITALRDGAEGPVARVSVGGAGRLVAVDLVPEARVGDTVLVHAGVALSLVHDEEDAEPH
jgi:hydrogenase maturation factor